VWGPRPAAKSGRAGPVARRTGRDHWCLATSGTWGGGGKKMGGHNSDLAHFKGCHDRRGGGERDRLSVRQVEREGGVRRSCRRRQPADNCPEPVGAGVRCGSAMRPAQDRGGGVMGMWARPHYRGLNLFKPSQADSNKFQFNLNMFKLILIQTRPS
jgi:hypothetical protein